MIPQELEAQVIRLYHNEGWPIGTIATQLSVHHTAVRRVLRQHSEVAPLREVRARLIDPFVDFVKKTWQDYPQLPASRLWKMCRLRGYRGARDHFRASVRAYRPRKAPEAFLKLKTLIGEEAQVDWAHFGKLEVPGGQRQLLAFVGVLSYSRAIFVRFFLGQPVENLMRGLQSCFEFWGGCPRVVLFDNPKTVVLERLGQAVRLNPRLLDFSIRYRFEARPVAPYRGNEKGRVERTIRYLRSSFFLDCRWKDLDELNEKVLDWCCGEALERRWPQDHSSSVGEVFETEKSQLMALPADSPIIYEQASSRSGKSIYLRFDRNDYSIPADYVRQSLQIAATEQQVRILKDGKLVASHARSYGLKQVIEDPRHIFELRNRKREARESSGMEGLFLVAPSSEEFLEGLAKIGAGLGGATRRLRELLATHGADRLEMAIQEAMRKKLLRVSAVADILENYQALKGEAPSIPRREEPDERSKLRVTPHSLENYRGLTETREENYQ